MSSLENVKPGMRPRFLSQKIDAKDPEKKIPSTAANATSRSAKVEFLSAIHLSAHSALALIQGTKYQQDVQGGEHTGLDGVKEISALSGLFDISIDQERVSFRMDILHHDLETVETSCLRDLNFIAESFEKIFIDDTVGSSKKRKDMRNEESFILIETMFPIVQILGKINFLGSPERCLCLLVHLPNLPLVNIV
jgi:hypothetical protein